MSFSILRSKIQSTLEGISAIQKVYNYPKLPDDTGLPMVSITPSDADSDYETTDENKRLYTFVLRVFYETKSGGTSNAVSALEGLIDTIVDTFDQDDTLTGIADDLPSRYTLIQLVPTPSVWNYFIEQNYIMAEIKITAIMSIDIS
jgi:hypothetical protein